MIGESRRSPRAGARRIAWLLLVAAYVWLGARPTVVRADNPAVTATLSESATTVDEPVELRITVSGAGALGRVQPPEVDGLTIRERGTSQSFQVRNFSVTELNTYLYLVTPQRAGVFTLPETEIQVGVRKLRTPALTLSVTAAAAGGGGGRSSGGNGGGGGAGGAQVRAELLLPKRTAYVGEALPAEFRLSFGSRVELIEASDTPLLAGEGFTVSRWTQPQSSGLRLGGGSGGQRMAHKAVLTAAHAGTLSLGPGETTLVVRVPSPRPRSNDPFFDDPLGGLLGPVFSPPRQVKVRAEPVALEVRPLPTAGQPADFTGGVGRFDLGALEVVSPARGAATARAGEPVVVRMSVRGQGNFDRLGAPRPETADGLRFYEPKDRFKADDDVGLSGTKTFEQTFIPDGPRNSVPGFHLSYFDPVTGTYQTLRTPPVPLKILPGAIAAPAAVTTPPPSGSTPTPPPAASAEETLRPVRAEPGVGVAADAGRPAYARRGFWLAQLVSLAGLATLLTVLRARARRRDATVQRRAAHAREHEALWRTVRDPHAGRRAFLDAAVRLLEGAPADDADVARIRARHAELAYGGGEGGFDPAAVPAEERAEVLMVLRGNPAGARPARAAAATALCLAFTTAGFAAAPSAARAGDDFTRGNAAYRNGQFAEAAGAYEREVARSGERLGTNVFYNLGNAYARLDQRGRAVADYRRALLHDPRHADAAANLALVRRQLRVPADAVLPPALPPWLTDRLPVAVTVHGANAGAWTAALGGWLFLGGLALAGDRARRGRALGVAFGVGLPLALLGAGVAWTLGRPAREAARTAVVIARRADAHEQPTDNARTVGTLTEGCEVRLLLARGPWSLVALADGRRGFVPADRLEAVGGW